MHKPQVAKQGRNQAQQTAKSGHKTVQTESRNGALPPCSPHKMPPQENHPTAHEHASNSQKCKATYSAQYQASCINQEQPFNTNNPSWNIPNREPTGCSCCNTVPLYNVSTRLINNGQNISMDNANYSHNMQYPCTCSNVPPPMPPCEEDLWDLQFCRWWGWNWIRKREEMMNQKKQAVKPKRTSSSETEKNMKTTRKRRKQDDFFSWCNKLFKGRTKHKQLLKDNEKQQLQELYDTPCSSITVTKCPCAMDDWECRSLNLTGEYECYCGSRRKTSTSTIIVQNNTRHQRCKQNMRKQQSWVYEKSDSSSSEELQPCTYVCPQRNESSTEESVEYLSMRMAQVKSGGEDDQACCTCMKQNEPKNNVSCPCKMQKNQKTNICCPCMIKLVYKKPHNCNKLPKQKYLPQKCAQCRCYRRPAPSLPVCRCSRPRKVPQFCRLPPSGRHPQPLNNNCPEYRIVPKRKYVCRPCEEPRKKIRVLKKPKEIYCYCCCCNNCCCACNKKDVENPKPSKSEKKLNETADKCIGSKSMAENINGLNPNLTLNNNCQRQCYGMYAQVNDANFCSNFPIGDCIHDKVFDTGQFGVSKALQEGLYTSPVTGRLYSLNPKIFSVNQVLPQSILPKPLDVNEKVFNINPVEPSVDEEHKHLLAAVCEAIMSSRSSTKNHRQAYIFPKTDVSPNNKRRSHYHPIPPIYKRPRSDGQYFIQQSSDEIDFTSDKTGNTTPSTELEELNCKNFTVSHDGLPKVSKPFDYKILLSPSNAKLPLPNLDLPENLKYNIESLPNHKSVTDMSGKTRYFVAQGKHGPVRHRYPTETIETQNYMTQQLHNLNLINSDHALLQISTNVPFFEDKYSRKNLNTANSWEDFSTANIFGNYKKGTCLNASLQNYYTEKSLIPQNLPTIQKSSTENFTGESGDSSNSGDTSVAVKKNLPKEEADTVIPFNSPRNWIQPPKLTGISMTGLFSAVGDVKRITKTTRCNKKKPNNKSRYNTDQLRNQRLYNSLFSTHHSDYSEGFVNLPYNYNPVPNSQSVARNPTIFPSLVLNELPANVAKETQTNNVRSAVPKGCSSKELNCTCKNEECKNQKEKIMGCIGLLKENDIQSKSIQAACSKVTRQTSTPHSQALQTSCSKTNVSTYIVQPQTSFAESIFKQTETDTGRAAKASNTIYSMDGIAIPKSTEVCDLHCKKQTNNLKPTQINISHCKLPQPNLFISSQGNKPKPTTTDVDQIKLPQTAQSRITATSNINSKSAEINNDGQTTQSTTSILFTKKYNSEKEIGCTYYNEVRSKDFQNTSSTNVNSLQFPFQKTIEDNSEGICVYLQHEAQGVDFSENTCVNIQNSEKLLTIINGLSERDLNNIPIAQRNVLLAQSNVPLSQSNVVLPQSSVQLSSNNELFSQSSKSLAQSNVPLIPSNVPLQDMPTTSKCVDCTLSNIDRQISLPKTFTSATPTPVYINTATSPFNFKYATTRTRDRSLTKNFVKDKVPKRESPFSMFCSPVPAKGIHNNNSSNNEITETGSLSRPDRQVVVAKPKNLKLREKQWKY